MKKYSLLLLFFIALKLSAQTITGFSPNNAATQIQTEQKFDAQLNAQHVGATIKQLASKPHNLGSKGSKEVADTILNRYKSYGFDVHIETFSVLFPTPKNKVAGNDVADKI